jgi:HEAT repeat protein
MLPLFVLLVAVCPLHSQQEKPGQPPLIRSYTVDKVSVEAGFVPLKAELVLGEPLTVTFSVKNVGKKEFGYWFGGDYRGTGRHDRFKITAHDANGLLLRDPKADENGNVRNLGGIMSIWTVKPGETKTHVLNLADFRAFEQPGAYTISCRFGIAPGKDVSASDREAVTVATTFRITLLPRTEDNVGRVLKEYVKQARTSSGETLNQTIAIICSFAQERAVPDLVAMAADGEQQRRIAALGGLGRFTTDAAVQAALRALHDLAEPVRVAAASALGSMKTEAAVTGLLARLPAEKPAALAQMLPALGRTRSPRAFKPLVEALEHANAEVSQAAVKGLAEMQNNAALLVLLRCTGDDRLDRREEVVSVLVRRYGLKTEPLWLYPLIRAGKRYPYGGPNPQSALNLLAYYGGEKNVPALVRCLEFKEPAPASYTNYYVCQHLQSRLKVLKVDWHHQPEKPQQVQENGILLRQLKRWLLEHGADKGLPPLEKLAPTRPPELSPKIAVLLEQLGSTKFTERDAAARALAGMGDEALDALRWQAATGKDLELQVRARQLVERMEPAWLLRRYDGHDKVVLQVAFSPDGKRAASGSKDGRLRVWEPATGKELHLLLAHTGGTHALAFSPNGRLLVTGGNDRSPDGKLHVTGGGDGLVRLWQQDTGRPMFELRGHTGTVTCIAFSPDGKQVLSGGDDATVRLWDLETRKELFRLRGHTDGVCSVAFSPDGKQALTAGLDGTVRLWEVASGKELRVLRGHIDAVWRAVFLPDGKRCLSVSCDRTLRLWDLTTGKEMRRFLGHTESVYTVALTPDGRRAVSGGHDGTLRLWDVDTGAELRRRYLPTGWVESVATSPDGAHALAGGSGNTVERWELKNE